jgi:flagellar biosynthesis protein FlhA
MSSPASLPAAPAASFQPLNRFLAALSRNTDMAMAVGLMMILTVLVLPMPAVLLDVGLALSFLLAVLVLMTAMFIEKPLDLSSFPTILLVVTMLRLSLNMASTRLILTQGHEGTHAAGHVIEAFGTFLMQGNTVIGIIVFAILLIVNFVVITKGSGRIAEVGARFSLDAMPGKQMAIDADLSAGLIDETTAKNRRKELEDESTFYGAMDGAAKFVRGDAIAGLLITFINVIGGIIIGMLFESLPFKEAGRTYTFLTIGDGLVTQIPALLVSLAAGMIVTKSGNKGSMDKAVVAQLGGYPGALGMSAGLMAMLAFLPGIPTVIFLSFAGVTGTFAWRGRKTQRAAAKAAAQPAPGQPIKSLTAGNAGATGGAAPASDEVPISKVLQIDSLRVELGYGLLPLINGEQGVRLPDQIKALRKQLAGEIGFVVPSVRIQDNLQLPADCYVIRVKEIEAGRATVRVGKFLAMDPAGGKIDLPGEPTLEPTFGLAAQWVEMGQKEEAIFRNYTVVEPSTVLITHLTEIIKDNMAELLSYTETQKLLDQMGEEYKKLVSDVVPDRLPVGSLQRVLQNLLKERVSIRDMPAILEGVAEASGLTRNLTTITEHVRACLSRYISESHINDKGHIPLITLSPEWENAFSDALVGAGEDKQLAMAPSKMQDFVTTVRQSFERQAALGESPVLLTTATVRPYVRNVIERFRPATPVLSQNEIHPKAKIKTVGVV